MPGANTRALDKARSLAADSLILDLEDAVAPDQKAAARDNIAAALVAGGYGHRELVVRINGLDTPWGADDLAAIAPLGPDALLLPKVETPAMVARVAQALADLKAPARTTLWAMMETPRGILRAEAIAAETPRLTCLVMGTSDLVKDLRARHTAVRLPLAASLGLCVLAARAHGLSIVDGVHLDLKDDAGFEALCQQGVDFGFDGKTLIHPSQIEAANRIFAPSEASVAWSRRIIAAYAEAQAAGQGIVLVDGKLVENLHVETARQVVAMAEAIAARG